MGNQMKTYHNLVECLLSSQNFFPSDHIDSNCRKENSGTSELQIPDVQNMFAAPFLMEFADKMPGGFFICRADGDEEILFANKAMVSIFNCDTMEEFREWTGNSFKGIVHPDDLESVEQSIREQIENSQYDLDYVEYRIIQKGGEIRWIDDYGHFVHSETAGDLFYVFVGDKTEKRKRQMKEKESFLSERLKHEQNEKQLKNQIEEYGQELEVINQEHLRRLEIIEGLSIDYESIFYVDLNKNRIKAYRVGKRFEKQFTKDNQIQNFEKFDADYIENFVFPDDRELLLGVTDPEYIRRKLSEERSFYINYRVLQDETTVYMQLRIVKVGNEKQVSQIIMGYRNVNDVIMQEMTQKKILEEALNEANLANGAKNLFLSNMSHDIRTPMNAIIGFTSLVKKHINDKKKVSDYLDMILESSDQLMQLLNDVLEISRIESGKIQIEECECSLMDLAYQVQMDVLPRAAAKNITVSLDVSSLTHDIVSTDQAKLTQILSCIVDNAVKYTRPGGRVKIMVVEQEEAKEDRMFYQFIVGDNGIGISKEFLTRIFEPFEREKNTTSSGIHGTGLGMTIARDLVEILDGTIDISSVVGKGSKFTVTLPLAILERKPVFPDVDNNTQRLFSSHKRILVVDDNEINLEIENEVLKDAGFLVETAEDGSIAVEKVKQSEPGFYDLILMDIQMPVMDGYHAAKAIRKLENPALAGIPIIAVSANAFEEDKRTAMESGMNAHLAKPLDTSRLYKLIQKFLKDV